jgi:hypothetical protein
VKAYKSVKAGGNIMWVYYCIKGIATNYITMHGVNNVELYKKVLRVSNNVMYCFIKYSVR